MSWSRVARSRSSLRTRRCCAYPDATIYVIDENGIEPTVYEDTEHYRLTRAFLENPPAYLRHLLADG